MVASSWGTLHEGISLMRKSKLLERNERGNEHEKEKTLGMAHGNGNGHWADAGDCSGG